MSLQVDPQQKFLERRRLVYDATNRRERRLEEIEIGSDKSYYDQLILWNEVHLYILSRIYLRNQYIWCFVYFDTFQN